MRQTTPHQPTITTQQFTKTENFSIIFATIVFHFEQFAPHPQRATTPQTKSPFA
jgi:hypothetical protein